VPIGMLLALLATLSVSLAVFPHRGPIISCVDSPCCQSSTPDVAPTNPFEELSHNSRALLSVYTYKKRVRKSEPVELVVDEGKLARDLWFVDSANLHRFYLSRWVRSDPWRPQSLLS